MDRTRIVNVLDEAMIGNKVLIRGWVRTKRDSKGGFSFIELNDGSCMTGVQVVADGALPNYESDVLKLTTGSSAGVVGTVKESPGKGQKVEVHAESLEVFGGADAEFPIQKKRHTFEYLREVAHLRTRTNTFGAMARVRNALCFAIHEFFQSRGFVYLNSPIITASDCEGAGELFHVTTFDLARVPLRGHSEEQVPEEGGAEESRSQGDGRSADVDFSRDFFGRPAHLTVSGQLQAEIFACSVGDVYTFGPTFRAENSNTSRHLAEFWMVEPEMAFCDLDGDMRLAEEFLKAIITAVLQRCEEDMAFFDKRIQPGLLEMLGQVVGKEFVRLPYTEGIEILKSSGEKFEYPVEWGQDLQSEHERYLTERHFERPVILYDYPRTLKPFYMRVGDDGRTVRAMDVLVPKVGELIGGSQREERLDVLVERMKEQGLNPEDYWWYLDLRRWGSVPHAGFGLGLERVLQFVTGMANIRDCIPFPRTPGNAEF
jgi:asparaginyl-tRNA synthetase